MPRRINDLHRYILDHIEIDPTSGCWIWKGPKDAAGYGQIAIRKHKGLVHRAMFELCFGKISKRERMCVCHKCDNPPCCNPGHLFLGTDGDNIRDSYSKGRMRLGINHNWGRLTDEEILAIRRASGTQAKIAAEFGVSQGYVSEIKSIKKRKRICQKDHC